MLSFSMSVMWHLCSTERQHGCVDTELVVDPEREHNDTQLFIIGNMYITYKTGLLSISLQL